MTFLPAAERANLPCVDWLSIFAVVSRPAVRVACSPCEKSYEFFQKPFRFGQMRCVLDKRGGARTQTRIC